MPGVMPRAQQLRPLAAVNALCRQCDATAHAWGWFVLSCQFLHRLCALISI